MLVSLAPHSGGADIYLRRFTEFLLDRAVSCSIICLPSNAGSYSCLKDKIHLLTLNISDSGERGYDRKGVYYFIRLLRCLLVLLRHRPDHIVLNQHVFGRGVFLVRACHWLHIPMSIVVHCVSEERRAFVSRSFTGSLVNVFAISEFTKQKMMKHSVLSSKNICVVHGCYNETVEYEKSVIVHKRKRIRERYSIRHGDIVFLIVSQLCESKGIELALQALRLFRKSNHDAKLVIVGDGDYRADIETLIHDYEVGQAVHLTGWVNNPHDFYYAADAQIMPSKFDNIPLVLMEAMSSGLPIISSDVGGVEELIQNGVNGRIFKTGDACDLYEQMMDFFNNPDKTQKLTLQAETDVKRWNSDVAFNEILNIVINNQTGNINK